MPSTACGRELFAIDDIGCHALHKCDYKRHGNGRFCFFNFWINMRGEKKCLSQVVSGGGGGERSHQANCKMLISFVGIWGRHAFHSFVQKCHQRGSETWCTFVKRKGNCWQFKKKNKSNKNNCCLSSAWVSIWMKWKIQSDLCKTYTYAYF